MSRAEKWDITAPGAPEQGGNGWLNEVLVGDCLAVAGALPGGCLDLVYIDPPYFTNRDFAGKARGTDGGNGTGGGGGGALAFSDRWQGGRTAYLHWLEPRVRACHRVLKETGVFLLHLDWHVVHYAKVLCDGVFGDEALQNELIWYYQTGGASKGRFSRKHDTILLYAKGEKFYFDGRSVAIPRTAKAMKRARSGRGARILATDTHKNPDDVLTVPALNPMAIERNGYPTQKPLALLELLVTALCPGGGVVGDFFCGSGTTLVAAAKLGRGFVGGDVSAEAVEVARGRLGELGERPDVLNPKPETRGG